MIGLFDRLGLEAKNQLSIVEDNIAELVRGVLLADSKASAPAARSASASATATAPPPAKRAAAAPAAAPATNGASASNGAPATAAADPIPTLTPVSAPRKAPRAKAAPEAPAEAPAVSAAPPEAPAAKAPRPKAAPAQPAEPPSTAPAAAAPRPVAPRPAPRPAVPDAPIPQLRPVPTGQSSIAAPRPPKPDAPGVAASAAPGPQVGMPGRPGVAPRPGQPGVPGQGYRPPQPRHGQAPPPGAPRPNRPLSNGPFRPLAPPGPRPFNPLQQQRPPAAPGAGGGPTGPMPSSGGRPGDRKHHREDAQSKKDREKDMLLEKERQRKKRGSLDAAPAIPPTTLENIEIPDVVTVQELANSMIISPADIIKELIKMGTMATITQNIGSDVAQQVAKKFGFNAVVKEAGQEFMPEVEEEKPELLTDRPPVVTVLGHVDHGKTSLLDKIRVANVASGEAGGITQKIGAYMVEQNGRAITFIDTPGHEAFTEMRARGARVTDVAILVVAADDGVMPQTIEAIQHVKAAGVPIVVAINKMDKDGANPDNVKGQLAEHGLQPVDWGGKIEMVPVSARTGDGIAGLLETVLLEADIKELKANKHRRATGAVIDAALDRGRGAVATVLIQNGTLRVGDVVVVGSAFGKIRALIDDKGKQVKKAGPSMPVQIMGLSDVPRAGDMLQVVSDERVAREAAAKRSSRRQEARIVATSGPRVSLETFMAMPADGARKTLNLVIKADGNGAVEALRTRVEGLSTAEVDIRVILAGVGSITPNDVNLASASNAVLIGFNIRPEDAVKRLAENEQVDLRFYQVIYDVENDLKKAMIGMLAPVFREIVLGRAEVREVFKVSKIGTIAGCYVQSGKMVRNGKLRVLRDSAIVFDGEMESLRRFKDDVKEVAEGYECGIQVARFQDLKPGDVLEEYASELVAPEAVPA